MKEQINDNAFNDMELDAENYIDESGELNFESFKNSTVLPLDLSTEGIVSWYNNKKLMLEPDFQRRNVWDNKRISLFIESLILDIPIPSILLAQNAKENKFIVIDGKQRINAVLTFWSPENGGKGIKLSNLSVLKELNGYTFKKLKEDSTKMEFFSRFENAIIKTSVLKNCDDNLLYFIFSRLNSGSVPLSTQELRQSLYPGVFTKYINEFTLKDNIIRRVLKLDKPDNRMKDVELIVRYFAFSKYKDDYQGKINDFFNLSCQKLNELYSDNTNRLNEDLIDMENSIKFVEEQFKEDAFKVYFYRNKENSFGPFNRPMFDLMSTYFVDDVGRKLVINSNTSLKSFLINLFKNNRVFADAFLPTTHSEEKTKTRFEEFNKAFRETYCTND